LGSIIGFEIECDEIFFLIDFGDSICKSASGNIDNYADPDQVK
jgi:hypothetical protein